MKEKTGIAGQEKIILYDADSIRDFIEDFIYETF